MTKFEKNFSWTMTVELKNGNVVECNTTNRGKGYKQSWYSTENAARKALASQMKWTTDFGNKVLAWAVVGRNGIIEHG